jgi:hypothetical protein
VSTEDGRQRLEGLLRLMEYQADAIGTGDDGIERLRQDLGMVAPR